MNFKSLAIKPELIAALNKLGYEKATPIQLRVIPAALKGESLVAKSPTGSGKTHAYLIPILNEIDLSLPRIQAIIVCPSRELARQTYEFAQAFNKFFPKLKSRLYTSETDIEQNLEGKKLPPHIAIGTPGRLKDILINKTIFTLQNVKYFVLDEADMLFEEGYQNDIVPIYEACKNGPAVLVFSATIQENLLAGLHSVFPRKKFIQEEKEATPTGVRHHLIDVKHQGKLNSLVSFLRIRQPYLALIFCSTKDKVKEIYEGLKSFNFDPLYFSGDLSERERKRTLKQIRENTHALIVTSDLLSRGMDIPDVTDVVSLDLPQDLAFYFHRAGRTGRNGKEGDSWVFYNRDEEKDINRLLGTGLKVDYMTLRNDEISLDKKPIFIQRKKPLKKDLPTEEIKEIKRAKAKFNTGKVEPMYKKKKMFAIEKVKKKYRKMAIRKSIRQKKNEYYRKKNAD